MTSTPEPLTGPSISDSFQTRSRGIGATATTAAAIPKAAAAPTRPARLSRDAPSHTNTTRARPASSRVSPPTDTPVTAYGTSRRSDTATPAIAGAPTKIRTTITETRNVNTRSRASSGCEATMGATPSMMSTRAIANRDAGSVSHVPARYTTTPSPAMAPPRAAAVYQESVLRRPVTMVVVAATAKALYSHEPGSSSAVMDVNTRYHRAVSTAVEASTTRAEVPLRGSASVTGAAFNHHKLPPRRHRSITNSDDSTARS